MNNPDKCDMIDVSYLFLKTNFIALVDLFIYIMKLLHNMLYAIVLPLLQGQRHYFKCAAY